ncbi:beta-ketoacyl synthase N-terminal-like domain-containing protein [Streptomyces diastatochromogenes]|nr:beta-ketoacyl synthase N-terminal-like domain-containing protein [Streptomyces diastatochromogenes]
MLGYLDPPTAAWTRARSPPTAGCAPGTPARSPPTAGSPSAAASRRSSSSTARPSPHRRRGRRAGRGRRHGRRRRRRPPRRPRRHRVGVRGEPEADRTALAGRVAEACRRRLPRTPAPHGPGGARTAPHRQRQVRPGPAARLGLRRDGGRRVSAVALAGTGLISPLGPTPAAFWRGLLDGRRAFGELRGIDGDFRSRVVAAVPHEDCPAPAGRRKEALATTAARQALDAAGLPALPDGALVVLVSQTPVLTDPEAERNGDFAGPRPQALLAACRADARRTTVVHLSHACASAAFAASFARDWLLSGLSTTALVVGASALNRYEYASMDVVKTLSPHGARPFDAERDGITVGEGGGAFVLETARSARDRGHRPEAWLSGAACLVDTTQAVASAPDAVRDCMRAALDDAGVHRVDYVHAHATGTAQGDAAEAEAVAELAHDLGIATPLPMSSHKGAIGHLLHASAFPGLVAAAGFLREGWIPGTPGCATGRPCPTA